MRLRDLLILTCLLTLFFGILLGSRPLSVPDEGRYAEIPREMVASGDWLTPRLNSVKYFEKPPLFYWIEAVLIRLFGLSEWSVRLGPAMLALLGCLAVFFAGNRMFGRLTGLFSAIILATSVLYFALSRLITLDMPVTVFLTVALLSFLLGTREPAGRTRMFFFWGFYAFSGLAVLTKGLIGMVFPGMIIFFWMLVTGEWRILRSMHLLSGSAVFFAIAAPWHMLVGRANPEFFDFYFIREHFQRYLTKVHHHYKPAWFYLPVLLGGLFPWSAFLLQAVRHAVPPNSWRDRKNYRSEIFLLLWGSLIFLFFSASSSKLIPYLLPVLPPLALLVGRYLADGWNGSAPWGFRAGEIAFGVLCILLSAALIVLPRYRPDIAALGTGLVRPVMILILLFGGLTTLARRKRPVPQAAVITIAATFSLFLVTAGALAPSLDTRSLKPLAMTLKPLLKADDEIVHYHNYFQDLPVYLERRMTIAGWKGELDFGTTIEDTSGWMIDDAELWKRWQEPRRIFLVAGAKDAELIRNTPGRRVFPVARNKNTVILSNSEVRQ